MAEPSCRPVGRSGPRKPGPSVVTPQIHTQPRIQTVRMPFVCGREPYVSPLSPREVGPIAWRLAPLRARSRHPAPLRDVLCERRKADARAPLVELLRNRDRPRNALAASDVADLCAVGLRPAFIHRDAVREISGMTFRCLAGSDGLLELLDNRWLSS